MTLSLGDKQREGDYFRESALWCETPKMTRIFIPTTETKLQGTDKLLHIWEAQGISGQNLRRKKQRILVGSLAWGKDLYFILTPLQTIGMVFKAKIFKVGSMYGVTWSDLLFYICLRARVEFRWSLERNVLMCWYRRLIQQWMEGERRDRILKQSWHDFLWNWLRTFESEEKPREHQDFDD